MPSVASVTPSQAAPAACPRLARQDPQVGSQVDRPSTGGALVLVRRGPESAVDSAAARPSAVFLAQLTRPRNERRRHVGAGAPRRARQARCTRRYRLRPSGPVTPSAGRCERTRFDPALRSGFGFRLEHLAAPVHASLEIDVMRAAQLAGILVFHISRPFQRIGRTTHPTPGGRCFSFRDRHVDSPEAPSATRLIFGKPGL
jgi:hypothetical protein